jgi:pimeloyl-ACP methyl ester carboxylesterase
LGPHGFTRLAYAEWGPVDAAQTVMCVHGLTRNARDFDPLANALADRGYRVVAPDMPGRARSAWLSVPDDYGYPLYLSASAALYARLQTDTLAWIGTSMGGLIGMMLAGQSETPVRRLVINDIGPFLPKAALSRIGTYVGGDPRFADLDAVEAYLRRVHAPFGPLSDAQWRHLAVHSAVPAEPGRLKLHYDPAIALPFTQKEPADVDLWPVWEQVACPTLVLRGARSDVLLAETAVEMTKRGRAAASGQVQLIEIEECGHAPGLMDEGQIALVADFLGQG